MTKERLLEKLDAEVGRWNRDHRIGTRVEFGGLVTTTGSAAFIDGGRSCVIILAPAEMVGASVRSLALLVLRAILARMKPHRILFLLVLLSPFYAAAQTTTVTIAAGAPQPPQVSASYRGASGVAPIYYYVCAVFPSGSVCRFLSAIAKNTQGIAALGGNNTVTVTWTPIGGATGYYVMRFPGPTFSGSCTSFVVAALSSGTSYVDSSPSTPAGVSASLRCALRLVRSRWTTRIIRRLGCCGISLELPTRLPLCLWARSLGTAILSSPSHRSFRTSLVAREPGELIS